MDVIIEPEAEEDLKEMKDAHQKYVLERLAELEEETTGHKDSRPVRIGGRNLFRYKMRKNGRGGKDFRAIYDIADVEIRVIAVFHRDKGYQELSERV